MDKNLSQIGIYNVGRVGIRNLSKIINKSFIKTTKNFG